MSGNGTAELIDILEENRQSEMRAYYTYQTLSVPRQIRIETTLLAGWLQQKDTSRSLVETPSGTRQVDPGRSRPRNGGAKTSCINAVRLYGQATPLRNRRELVDAHSLAVLYEVNAVEKEH
ncbi:MAG: hypothetical protein ACRYGF_00510 [Janthinobacterium lividum]